jgi:hypothetical protein
MLSGAQHLVFFDIDAMFSWRRSLSMSGEGTFAESQVRSCKPVLGSGRFWGAGGEEKAC